MFGAFNLPSHRKVNNEVANRGRNGKKVLAEEDDNADRHHLLVVVVCTLHTHEVNKQVRSFAEDKIDMSDGRGVGLYHPLRRYSSCLAHAEFSNMCGRVRDRVARKTTISPSLFLLAFKRASQSK